MNKRERNKLINRLKREAESRAEQYAANCNNQSVREALEVAFINGHLAGIDVGINVSDELSSGETK